MTGAGPSVPSVPDSIKVDLVRSALDLLLNYWKRSAFFHWVCHVGRLKPGPA